MNNNYNTMKTWLTNHINIYYKDDHEYNILLTWLKNHPSYNTWKYNIPYAFKITNKSKLCLYISFSPQVNKFRIVSWLALCSDKKRAAIDPLTSAMRFAIRRQIYKYKRSNDLLQCHLCQNTKQIEVDHYPLPFCDLKRTFLNQACIIIPTDFNYHPKRGCYMFKKQDTHIKSKWQRYHLKHAQFRLLCSRCNKLKNHN